MAFHRLTVPTYNGGLPGGYDYVNNAVSGTPAPVDGPKVVGPNIGSYFVGFGEDGRSLAVNRGLKAVAENTDFLDDLFHKDVALPTRTADTTPGTPIASLVFPAGTYIGVPGTPNTAAGINTFVEVLDANDNEIVDTATGNKVKVSSIAGATVGTNFSTGSVTFNFSPSIPSGTTYRIYYATRSNLASLPIDAFSNIKIRGAQEVPAALEDYVYQASQTTPGSLVAKIISSVFETPDGVRRVKSGSMTFSVDPDASFSAENFLFKMRGNTILELTNTGLGGATTGCLTRANGYVDRALGTFWFSDANIASAAGIGGLVVPLSGASSANGDKYLRIGELGALAGGLVASPSIIQQVNGRWTITCGDGVNSFGDFNGTGSIQRALDYIINTIIPLIGISSFRVQVKAGEYSISNGLGIALGAAEADVIIEGVGAMGEVLINTSSTAAPFNAGFTGRLTLRNLTISRISGSLVAVLSLGQLLLEDVEIFGMGIRVQNPTPFTGTGWPFLFKACRSIITAGATQPCLEILAAQGTIGTNSVTGGHRGFIFEDCILTGATDTPIVRVKVNSNSITAGVVSGLLHERCTITLGKATLASGTTMTGNPGVLDIDPGTTADKLILVDASWNNCTVTGGTTSSSNDSSILAHIIPLANGAVATTNRASLHRISIRGGVWLVPTQNNSLLNPFVLVANNITLSDVVFVGNPNNHGVAHADAAFLFAQSTSSSINFATTGESSAFNFYAARLTPIGTKNYGFVMHNVTFQNFGRDSNSGDVTIVLPPAGVDINGVMVGGYSTTASFGGTVPTHRVLLVGAPTGFGLDSGSRGAVRNLHVGEDVSGASAGWTTGTSGGTGILLLVPNGRLRLEGCSVYGMPVSSSYSTSNGFSLRLVAGQVSSIAIGLSLRDCSAVNCNIGCSIGHVSAPFFTDLAIVGGLYKNNHFEGIQLYSGTAGLGMQVLVNGVLCRNNANAPGLSVNGGWNMPDTLIIADSSFHDNDDGSAGHTYQCIINNSGTDLAGVFENNSMRLSGTRSILRLRENSGAYAGTHFRGPYTSISGTTVAFDDGVSMLLNFGTLQTS